MSDFSYGIITVSDRCHRGESVDESGPIINLLLKKTFSALKISQTTVPDEQVEIEKLLKYYSDELKLQCIFTTGGTGFAPRDVTPEATRSVINKECPQFAQVMLMEGLKKTQFAALSRAICGVRNRTLIINFPGSKKAVVESFEAIRLLIPHAIELICDQKSKTEGVHREIQKMEVERASNSFSSASSVISEVSKDFSEVSKNFSEASKDLGFSKTPSVFSEFSSTTQEVPKMAVKPELVTSAARAELVTSAASLDPSDEIVANYIQSLRAETPKAAREPPKSAQELPKSSSTPSRSASEVSELLELTSRSSVMEELILDDSYTPTPKKHVCPHKTAKADDKFDRNSPFPMIEVEEALKLVFGNVKNLSEPTEYRSPMNCPPFRASIKDGYAIKSSTSKVLKVIGSVNAGDKIVQHDFGVHECYKINTGAAVPHFADAILQVEDTKLIKSSDDGSELEIEVLKMPRRDCDIRKAGSDIARGEILFTTSGLMDVAEKTILASVGLSASQKKPKVGIISTGDELVDPTKGELREGQIFDSNTTMLKLLCEKYGFEVKMARIAKDDYESLKSVVSDVMSQCDVIVSSGGVSMGDKDFVKKLLVELRFKIQFGRVNMKPGKPMTFASHLDGTSYFALPGNPVSAFVCFHTFVLPALRFMSGFPEAKCLLPTIHVILQDLKYELDERPEFVRATVSYNRKNSQFQATITANQISSRIASLISADVLVHLPPAGASKSAIIGKGYKLKASIINQFFISANLD